MSSSDPIDLLYGGMDQLGPGSDVETLRVLGLLPRRDFGLVVDAGCGTGRQTLVLARAGLTVKAVDAHQPFLDRLMARARDANLEDRIETCCLDMALIPDRYRRIDLLWSEGAAYSIGFQNALSTWAPALSPGGLAVVSELSWLTDRPPAVAAEFFRTGYPEMRSVEANQAVVRQAGYRLLETHLLPPSGWVQGYYDQLKPRASALLDHPEPAVRQAAGEVLAEIDVFDASEGSYGYVFFVLERSGD